MSRWKPWPKRDAYGLARYVTDASAHYLRLPVSRFDAAATPAGRLGVVRALYEALAGAGIQYASERYHPDGDNVQEIRAPAEILGAPGEGTCLDLAALFCGLCVANELIPLLIVLEGHALAAVAVEPAWPDWADIRPEGACFETPLEDPARLRALMDDGLYVPVECTGFAHSETLGAPGAEAYPETVGRVGGLLSFERAVQAGREQLERADRPLRFAVELAIARYVWRIDSFDLFDAYQRAEAPLAARIRLLEFKALVADRTRNFVGRDFIFNAIDALLDDREKFPSGYILIRGEPGIGKTAVAAQLVKTREYVHHFNVATQNIRSAADFLQNVCAQLIVSYGLPYDDLPRDAERNSNVLVRLLHEAAAKNSGRPVVVVVDALDEAEDDAASASTNRLLLPPTLPDGVVFILTSREKEDYRLQVDRREDLYLRDSDPNNESDVRRFVERYVDEHGAKMGRRLGDWGIDIPAFVDVMTKRSQGNFMYLVHVLRDILEGTLSQATVDDIENLPTGLREYYRRHWREMQAADPAAFERYYEPVVCMLATAMEPVTVTQVASWTKLPTSRVKRVLAAWTPFLDQEKPAGGDALYRIYHASFQDFLRGEVDLTAYNSRIAEAALQKIGNWDAP